MVLAHVVDAWTRDADRDRTAFYWASFVGGLAAPAFLFLAGLGTALSGAAKLRAGASRLDATLALARRGLMIFGLAFVFRAQAIALGWGAPIGFLKVDILNVMGPALVAGAVCGGPAPGRGRVLVASGATVALAMAAPLIRTAAWIDGLPAPLQWYWRPTGRSHQLHVGAVERVRLRRRGGRRRAGRGARPPRRAPVPGRARAAGGGGWRRGLLGVVPAVDLPAWPFGILGCVADLLLPAAGVRHGALAAGLEPAPPPARCPGAPLATIGAASLFAYWVHVEAVYGGVAIPLKRRLPFELALVGTLAVTYGLTRLVPWARGWVRRPTRRRSG